MMHRTQLEQNHVQELVRKCFIVGYSKTYAKMLEYTTASHCPKNCNQLNPVTKMFRFNTEVREGREPSNFLSMAAHKLFEWDTKLHMPAGSVSTAFSDECAKYSFLLESDKKLFIDNTVPFFAIGSLWKYEFEMCLFELIGM